MRRLLLPALAFALLLAAPAAAAADSGSITLTDRDVGAGTAIVTVSLTVTNDRCDTTACDWIAVVSRVGAGQPCTTDQLVLGSEDEVGAGTRTLAFPDKPIIVTTAEPRLCLYYTEAGPPQLLAQLDVSLAPEVVPPPPPPPPDPPPPEPEPRPVLTVKTASKHVKPILTQVFKARFKQRRGFRRSCTRTKRDEVRCIVRWKHKRLRFKGPLWIAADPDSPHGVSFDERIRKTRIRG